MKEIGLDPATLYPEVLPRPPAIAIDSLSTKVFISDVPKKPQTPEESAQISAQELGQTEEQIDLADALAPIYDVLASPFSPWWILEIIPLIHKFQLDSNKWTFSFGWNLGRGRHVPNLSTEGVKVHRTVKTRLDAEYKNGKKYKPKANLDLQYVTWVD